MLKYACPHIDDLDGNDFTVTFDEGHTGYDGWSFCKTMENENE